MKLLNLLNTKFELLEEANSNLNNFNTNINRIYGGISLLYFVFFN